MLVTFIRTINTPQSLLIEKTASAQFIRPGGTLDYNISYQNTGNDQATNVTITDIVDSHLQIDPASCNPPAQQDMDRTATEPTSGGMPAS